MVDATELALDYGMELSLPWSWSPQSPQSHLPKSHQKHCTLHKSAEDSWAELELLCSPPEYGSSLITAVPSAKSAATADVVPQICQHSKAALGLLCCPEPQECSTGSCNMQCFCFNPGRSVTWGAPHGGGDSTAVQKQLLIFDCCAPPPLLDMVLRIFSTPFSWSWTAVLSPPQLDMPHVGVWQKASLWLLGLRVQEPTSSTTTNWLERRGWWWPLDSIAPIRGSYARPRRVHTVHWATPAVGGCFP